MTAVNLTSFQINTLKCLLDQNRPMFGAEIAEQLGYTGAGSFYKGLKVLVREKALKEYKHRGQPHRKYYTLTPKGRAWVHQALKEFSFR